LASSGPSVLISWQIPLRTLSSLLKSVRKGNLVGDVGVCFSLFFFSPFFRPLRPDCRILIQFVVFSMPESSLMPRGAVRFAGVILFSFCCVFAPYFPSDTIGGGIAACVFRSPALARPSCLPQWISCCPRRSKSSTLFQPFSSSIFFSPLCCSLLHNELPLSWRFFLLIQTNKGGVPSVGAHCLFDFLFFRYLFPPSEKGKYLIFASVSQTFPIENN